MGGAGLDAAMIRDAGSLKDRIGRGAYMFSGSKNLRMKPFHKPPRSTSTAPAWGRGRQAASCLVTSARCLAESTRSRMLEPHDGVLELGIITADGIVE